jgi:hypothetical protein
MLEEEPAIMQLKNCVRESFSEYNGGRRGSREASPFQKRINQISRQEFEPLLNEEFGKKLYIVEDIVKKKKMFLIQG